MNQTKHLAPVGGACGFELGDGCVDGIRYQMHLFNAVQYQFFLHAQGVAKVCRVRFLDRHLFYIVQRKAEVF